ncbi:hypothetical protein L1987_43366 [Smallanthus sonchifolius]|uniref:Uncharacterized protein n=1 Tax=Smallanthus sonchifolius TaxID=185202 RepID=A0ACB9GMN4_9ASTR|nr:hypothetical protein L1987_43366 [Smallanthus sonchifolius]
MIWISRRRRRGVEAHGYVLAYGSGYGGECKLLASIRFTQPPIGYLISRARGVASKFLNKENGSATSSRKRIEKEGETYRKWTDSPSLLARCVTTVGENYLIITLAVS